MDREYAWSSPASFNWLDPAKYAPASTPGGQGRVRQSDITPGAVTERMLNDIITLTPTDTNSATLSNGGELDYQITTRATNGGRCLVIPAVTVFNELSTASTLSSTTAIPYGSSVNPDQWQVYWGPDWIYNASTLGDYGGAHVNFVTKIYVRNISAGANQPVLTKMTGRFVRNSNAAT